MVERLVQIRYPYVIHDIMLVMFLCNFNIYDIFTIYQMTLHFKENLHTISTHIFRIKPSIQGSYSPKPLDLNLHCNSIEFKPKPWLSHFVNTSPGLKNTKESQLLKWWWLKSCMHVLYISDVKLTSAILSLFDILKEMGKEKLTCSIFYSNRYISSHWAKFCFQNIPLIVPKVNIQEF